MESPNYNYQPNNESEDDSARWLNEGGHLAPTDESLMDENEVLTDDQDTLETQINTPRNSRGI